MSLNKTKLVTKQPAKAKQSVKKPAPYKGKASGGYSSVKGRVPKLSTAKKNYQLSKLKAEMDTDTKSRRK